MYKEIDTYELEQLLNNGNINLIDIRDNYAYLSGTISNALNISANELLKAPSKYLNKEEKYYIFCSYGSSSKSVCNYLSKFGYNVFSIIGGYNSYKGSK